MLLLISSISHAWVHHSTLTKLSLKNHPFIKYYPKFKVTELDVVLKKISGANYTREKWLKELNLNPKTQFDFVSHYELGKPYKFKKPGEETTALEVLVSYSDEPDWGMDQDLFFTKDQKYLGGTKGPSSQAWRHMYLPRWNPMHPYITFHYPLKTLGVAPDRARMMADWSKMAFEAKDPYWGFRFLAWSLHYIQDLGQPFHSCLLPTFKFIDHKAFFEKGFSELVKSTTQRVSNYHYVYEYYVDYQIQKDLSPSSMGLNFRQSIIENSETENSVKILSPEDAALNINHNAALMAPAVGRFMLGFFGDKYMDPSIDILNNLQANYEEIVRPRVIPRSTEKELQRVTIEALKRVGIATRAVATWVDNQGFATAEIGK